MTELDRALSLLQKKTQRNDNQGCIMILMPEYRPDLTKAFAHHLSLPLFDYRSEVMSEKGLEAHRISLPDLTETLRAECQPNGVLAFNIEALLAAKPDSERKQWLSSALDFPWPGLLILPLAIFTADVSTADKRVLDLRDSRFEEQSLTNRLLH